MGAWLIMGNGRGKYRLGNGEHVSENSNDQLLIGIQIGLNIMGLFLISFAFQTIANMTIGLGAVLPRSPESNSIF